MIDRENGVAMSHWESSVVVILISMATCICFPVATGYPDLPTADEVGLEVSWSDSGVLLKWNDLDQSLFYGENELTISRMCYVFEDASYYGTIIHLNGTSTEYLDTDVQTGRFYKYDLGVWQEDFFVSFCGDHGFVYGGGLPAAPSSLSITLRDASIDLSWKLSKWQMGGGEFVCFDV